MAFIYPGGDAQVTTNLGLATWGMDEVLAENMILIDAAIGGGGSSVKINGVIIANPNFNNTTPTAPVSSINVVWQVDGGGNVSAYVPTSGMGTVTNVAMIGDGVVFNAVVPGSPVTTTGTLAPTLHTQIANAVFSGPTSGGAAAPTFRALVVADIPSLPYVTSVALTVPSIMSVSGSPITSAGTLAVTLTTEVANSFFAGPTSGGAATPTFRAIVAADLPASTGTVTSVALTAPVEFSVAGSPITSSGTLAITKATQVANTIWAGPTSGGAAQPTFRALVSADLPAGTGTVTSVALTVPSIMSVAGSPITTSGTLAVTLATQVANSIWAGPTTGAASQPTFRALVAADLPAGTGTVTSVAMTGDGVIFNTTVTGSPITTTGTLVPVLLPQTANLFLAGPTSGGAATPTFRAIGASDIPSGTVLWNQIGNASGALTLANGANNTTFNHTSETTWTWANTTAATVSTPQRPPIMQISGQYWTGSGSAADTWILESQLTAGTNGAVSLTLSHTGSTGAKTFNFGTAGNQAMSIAMAGTTSGSVTMSAGVSGGNLNLTGSAGAIQIIGASGLILTGSGSAQISLSTTVQLKPAGVSALTLTSGTGVTSYNNINTTGSGLAPQYAKVDSTAQTAAIGATTLYAVPATGAGAYRITWSADITTAATTSSVLGGTNGFQAVYTSPTDSVVKTTVPGLSVTSAANTTGTAVGGQLIVFAKASTNIQYQYDYTSVGVTPMAFELHIRLEFLG